MPRATRMPCIATKQQHRTKVTGVIIACLSILDWRLSSKLSAQSEAYKQLKETKDNAAKHKAANKQLQSENMRLKYNLSNLKIEQDKIPKEWATIKKEANGFNDTNMFLRAAVSDLKKKKLTYKQQAETLRNKIVDLNRQIAQLSRK